MSTCKRLKFGPAILLKYLYKILDSHFISYECRNGIFGSQGLDIGSGLGTKLQASLLCPAFRTNARGLSIWLSVVQECHDSVPAE